MIIVCRGGCKSREYDNKRYEDELFHFNTVQRPSIYKHTYTLPFHDHCYDCSAELFIIEKYLKNHPENKNTVESMTLLFNAISYTGRVISDPAPSKKKSRYV